MYLAICMLLAPCQPIDEGLVDYRARLAIRRAILEVHAVPVPIVMPVPVAQPCPVPACPCGCREGFQCRCAVEHFPAAPAVVHEYVRLVPVRTPRRAAPFVAPPPPLLPVVPYTAPLRAAPALCPT